MILICWRCPDKHMWLPFFLSVCPQGLLFLQFCGHRCQAAPTQTQRQQDPHCGLGEDPPHDQHHWSPHGQQETDKNTHALAHKWIVGTEQGPRSRAAFFSSTPIDHQVHVGTVISGLHMWLGLSRMLKIDRYTHGHMNTRVQILMHSQVVVSVHHVCIFEPVICHHAHYLKH